MTITRYDKYDKYAAEGTHEGVLKTRSAYDHGARGEVPTFYRYVVLETVFDPTLVDDNKASYWEHQLGVVNSHLSKQLPRNAIIAQRIMDGRSTVEPPMFLFPFFPPTLSMPCQPGEHVWVMFESVGNKQTDLGYWMCRIVGPGYVEDSNHTHAPRERDPSLNPGTKSMFDGKGSVAPDFRNGNADVDAQTGERYTLAETATISGTDEKAYEKLITDTDGGKLSHIEAVPRYRKRPGELALEGTNNTLISLGRDRTGAAAKLKADSTQGKIVDSLPDPDVPLNTDGAGSIDIVVGRGQTAKTLGKVVKNSLGFTELDKLTKNIAPAEGDPDMVSDRSRVLLSQKTRVDKNFNVSDFNEGLKGGAVKESTSGAGAVAIKSDKVLVVGRKDFQIIVTGNGATDDAGLPKDNGSSSKWSTVIVKENGDVYVQPASNQMFQVETDSVSLKIEPSDVKINVGSSSYMINGSKIEEFANSVVLGNSSATPIVKFPELQSLLTQLLTLLQVFSTGLNPQTLAGQAAALSSNLPAIMNMISQIQTKIVTAS